MKWAKVNGHIIDMQTGELICVMAGTDDILRDKMIELSPELFVALFSFVEQIENGKFAAKSVYNDLKEIFDRVPKEVFNDERMQVQ